MIKIKYHYTDDFRLKGFTLKGHAEYAEYGYDIVCSAVTSNAIGVDNSLNLLAKVEFESEIGQEGMIECIVKEDCLNDIYFTIKTTCQLLYLTQKYLVKIEESYI